MGSEHAQTQQRATKHPSNKSIKHPISYHTSTVRYRNINFRKEKEEEIEMSAEPPPSKKTKTSTSTTTTTTMSESSIKEMLGDDSIANFSRNDRGKEGFLRIIRKLVKDTSAEKIIGPLEDTLPIAVNTGKPQHAHKDHIYLSLYVEALRLVTGGNEDLLFEYLKRLLINRKLTTAEAINDSISVGNLVAHFTTILTTEVPTRRTIPGEENLEEEGPDGNSLVYIRKEHMMAVVALAMITEAFPNVAPAACTAIFTRMMACHPWRMDNENNRWEAWEFSQYSFNRLQKLIPGVALKAHEVLSKKAKEVGGGAMSDEERVKPIQQLLDWIIYVADKSYYENRTELVFDLYHAYEAAAETEPKLTIHVVKKWMDDSFMESGWEWSHKTGAMCYVFTKAMNALSDEQLTSTTSSSVRPVIEETFQFLIDPETNRINPEAEDCEEYDDIETLYNLIVEKLGITVQEDDEDE